MAINKINRLLTITITTAFVAACSNAGAENKQDASERHVIVPFEQLDFVPIRGDATEMAVAWGNPETGPSSVYLKFPPNFPLGNHTHSSNYHAIVIQGTTKHWGEGETEADAKLLGPGDFFYQGAGEWHEDSYPSDEEVIVFLHFDGPIDFLTRD